MLLKDGEVEFRLGNTPRRVQAEPLGRLGRVVSVGYLSAVLSGAWGIGSH